MAENNDKSLDILGVKPVAKSIEKVTDGVVDAAKAFLSRVCLPASEEFGLLLQDHVKSWRASRAAMLALKAEEKVRIQHGGVPVFIQPRIAHAVFDEGSWEGDETVHDMWAGLLASACGEGGGDDSNLVFIATLKQLSSMQVRVLRFAVETAEKYVSRAGWPYADHFECSSTQLKDICGTDDLIRIDRELDHLKSLDLLAEGFDTNEDFVDFEPRPLALSLYVRAAGFPGTPIEFWSLEPKPEPKEEAPETDAN